MRSLFADFLDGVRSFAPSRFPYSRFLLALLIGLAGALLFVWMGTPLPWMLGSIATTTVAALFGVRLAAPGVVRAPMIVVIGVSVGAAFTPDILTHFTEWWPTVLGLLLLGIVSAVVCIAYLKLVAGFDTPTAYFSGMPGGLIEMITLADEHGGDLRAVAFFHSVRILIIVFCLPFLVSLIEGTLVQTSSVVRPSIVDTSAVDFAWLLGTAVMGVVVGQLLHLPAIHLLGPMVVSAAIHIVDFSTFKPPIELLNIAQWVVGTSVGVRFVGVDTATLIRFFRLSIGMTVALLAITAAFAWGASRFSDYGFVPIFLAYAPGGTAEMSLVAIALHIEVAFVASHHIVRLFFVMAGAPLAYSALMKRIGGPPGRRHPPD